ncbi:MAG TPA: hypothetical protein VN908_06545 [Gemmatimonadales bacterium]|nr:hypothetical protein [Gemmatimonadales bacterium]
MDYAEQSKKVAEALELMANRCDEGFDTFNFRMEADFPGAYALLPGEVRMQVERAEGALTAARDYIRERAKWCRLNGEQHQHLTQRL